MTGVKRETGRERVIERDQVIARVCERERKRVRERYIYIYREREREREGVSIEPLAFVGCGL